MQLLWGTIAIVCAAAIVAGIVYLIQGELRQYRVRQMVKRLEDAGLSRRTAIDLLREVADYSRFNQDQLLRNRSESWDGRQ
jgi:hypothetical protein